MNFYLVNQTLSIFEPRKENSGIAGGKFLERTRVKKGGAEVRGWGQPPQPRHCMYLLRCL